MVPNRNKEMKGESELLVKRDGAICTLVVNRPEKHNLLTAGCLLEMIQRFSELTEEENIRAVVLRGSGQKAFSAGYDVSALPTRPSPDREESLKESSPLEQTLEAIRNFPYPVIAMINGDAYGGGCELAIGCDIRVAAKGAKMGMTPAKLGLVYPYPGYRRFLTVLGFNRTLEIFLTGRKYDTESCHRMGLVNYVVEEEHLESFTYELAREIAENAPLSLRGTKYALYKIAEYPHLEKKEEEELRSLFIKSLQSEDMEEGKRAFIEKRKPRFKGR
jgi:enoyl-CoA hydratase/carnithine racemase